LKRHGYNVAITSCQKRDVETFDGDFVRHQEASACESRQYTVAGTRLKVDNM
jgi:hypothetical protein